MAEDNKPKETIAASDSIRDLLNLNEEDTPVEHNIEPPSPPVQAGNLPKDLPFMENISEPEEDIEESLKPVTPDPADAAGPIEQILAPASKKGNEAYAFVLWAVKAVLPYIVIFAIGIGLYFYFFSDVSFTSIFKSNSITLEKVTTAASNKDLERLKSEQKAAYTKWMSQFFFAVNDPAIIDMDTDVSGNGLTNFEKYLLDLNPKVYSTRGLSQPDGQLVTQGINPWTGKAFTDKQKELVEKYISAELISNRITAAALTQGVTKFAQYVNPGSPYYVDPTELATSQGSGQTISSSEYQSNQAAYQASQQPGSGGGGSSGSNPGSSSPSTPGNLNPGTDIDQTKPGQLDIPANNISVPLNWTQDVNAFEEDLKKGIVHYPGTAMPGQMGTSYISGHSSGYLWDHSPYKQIFAVLGQVKDGTSFTITATRNDGKQVKFHYVVKGRGEYEANDQAQFVNTADSVVALSTCWPVGTTARRLVLFAELTQTEV